MATKLLLAVAALGFSAHAMETILPREMALMQTELGLTDTALFGADQDNGAENNLMELLAAGKSASPEGKARLRELAAEILDDSPKAEVMHEAKQMKKEEVFMAPTKQHVVEMSVASTKEAEAPAGVLGSMLGGGVSAGLEEVLTSLMLAKGGFSATPMGDTITKIQELVEKQMLPKILGAHTSNQNQLDKLAKEIAACGTTKNSAVLEAKKKFTIYKATSPTHKTCRVTEAEIFTGKTTCYEELGDKLLVKTLRCREFAVVGDKWADEAKNKAIVSKGAGESQETYIRRIHLTFCKPSALDEFLISKLKCEKATKEWQDMAKKCTKLSEDYKDQKQKCDNIQKQMDGAACSHAVKTKDACETYAECYNDKKAAYLMTEKMVKKEEKDRQAEWRATKRMQCLIIAFKDGKVEASEITQCKDKTHSTNHLVINYPKIKDMDACKVPDLYPMTAQYKTAEFASLPALAKGNLEANECVGVREISTTPAEGSPKTCKCERITLNGPFSPGALLKCVDCLDVRRTTDKDSCPSGTKLFSPQSREDWATMFASGAVSLRAPNWIIDITRPQNGCGGCTKNVFNSGNSNQKSWVTADKTAWWLRSTSYNEPNGDYHANCYLDLWHAPKDADSITWNDGNCNYHAKSYYCQPNKLSLTPKAGSPSGCVCKKVEMAGTFSPGALLKCTSCLDVHKATQKNSCPEGTKIFAPRTREDWQSFINSAGPLRSPHWIIDITRPQNGCGGCTGHAMNSAVSAQATWKTADGAPWWLRSSRYNEPNGDYHANCYLDLWQTPANSDSVTWNDGNCNYHSNAYYCQRAKR